MIADLWDVLVDLATVAAGLAAAIAIVLALRQERASKAETERRLAENVVAWAVTEDVDAAGGDGGVIVVNNTAQALGNVDVKTRKRVRADSEPEDDGIPAQRFGTLPPGTYYLQQLPAADGVEARWSAPMPVDTGGGRFVVTPPSAGGPAQEDDPVTGPVSLIPVARRPEPKLVELLRFDLAGETWHRQGTARLRRHRGPTDWDGELDRSEKQALDAGVSRRWDHSPDAGVVAFHRDFFTYLTGVQPADEGRATSSPARPGLTDLFTTVRLTAKQQAISFDLVEEGVGQGWFAGSGKGEIAKEFKIPWHGRERQRSVRAADGRPFTRPVADVPAGGAGRTAFFDELVSAVRRYLDHGDTP